MTGYGWGESRRVVVTDADTWVLVLPYDRPPLTANQRLSRWQRVRLNAAVREDVVRLATAARVPRGLGRVRVHLVYAPAREGRRDADNLVPTLKPACDGLIRYGLTWDDTPDHMDKPMPTIAPPVPGGRLWLVITDLSSRRVGW